MDNPIILIFQLIVLLFSVMIHEISHGYMAYHLGDPTAKDAGRLTLNPMKHIDPIGSILLPLMLFLVGSPVMFGWAKPVPYNPMNLKNPRRGSGLIALAGPVSNFSVAVIFALILKVISAFSPVFLQSIGLFLGTIIIVNIVLAVFNLVPIPPLDGSGILFSLLGNKGLEVQRFLEKYGFFILIIFIVWGSSLITPIINAIFSFLVGGL